MRHRRLTLFRRPSLPYAVRLGLSLMPKRKRRSSRKTTSPSLLRVVLSHPFFGPAPKRQSLFLPIIRAAYRRLRRALQRTPIAQDAP